MAYDSSSRSKNGATRERNQDARDGETEHKGINNDRPMTKPNMRGQDRRFRCRRDEKCELFRRRRLSSREREGSRYGMVSYS